MAQFPSLLNLNRLCNIALCVYIYACMFRPHFPCASVCCRAFVLFPYLSCCEWFYNECESMNSSFIPDFRAFRCVHRNEIAGSMATLYLIFRGTSTYCLRHFMSPWTVYNSMNQHNGSNFSTFLPTLVILKKNFHSRKYEVIYYFFPFSFIFISWRLITLQYCSGFCHTLTWISHGFTCVPHPDPPSHLPLHPLPLGFPSAPGPSACLMHPTWAGDLFHPR